MTHIWKHKRRRGYQEAGCLLCQISTVLREEQLPDLGSARHIHVPGPLHHGVSPGKECLDSRLPVLLGLDLQIKGIFGVWRCQKKNQKLGVPSSSPPHSYLCPSRVSPLRTRPPPYLRLPQVLPVHQHAFLLHIGEDAAKLNPVLPVELVKCGRGRGPFLLGPAHVRPSIIY